MVRIARLRISMSSAMRCVAGVSRFRNGVMLQALLGAGMRNRPIIRAFNPSIIAHQKSARPYNRFLRYKRTLTGSAGQYGSQAGRENHPNLAHIQENRTVKRFSSTTRITELRQVTRPFQIRTDRNFGACDCVRPARA